MDVRLLLVFGVFSLFSFGQKNFSTSFDRMGSAFEITLVAEDSIQAEKWLNQGIQEITRIEALISSWDTKSQTSKINANAGIGPVEVNQELFQLIKRSLIISQQTDGAFDISYAAADKVWTFDGRASVWPAEGVLEKALERIGYQKIKLDLATSSVYLEQRGMKIGFGAIGKGYAADRVKAILKAQGVSAGLVNASGDMQAWGVQADGKPWTVGIVNPMDKQKVFSWFDLQEKAVVTSGDYERFITIDGIRYGHIVDPRTAKPAKGIISATVFAPKAELADALATSIFVLGKENGLFLIDQLPEVEALLIEDDGTMVASKNIKLSPYE